MRYVCGCVGVWVWVCVSVFTLCICESVVVVVIIIIIIIIILVLIRSACCFDEAFWTKVKQKISIEWNQTENLDEIAKSVAEILTNRDYITIFKLDAQQDGNEIDVAILNALLKGNNNSYYYFYFCYYYNNIQQQY